jgi:hypothetical protein
MHTVYQDQNFAARKIPPSGCSKSGFVRRGFGTSGHGPKKKRFCFS